MGLISLGALLAPAGCATYRAERAQFESPHVTLYPTAPSATFSAEVMAARSNRK